MLCIHPIKLKGQKELVPCGQCCLCREQYAKQFAVRCCCESILHDKSVFITLTYDPKFLPKSVSRHALQLFLKRLRKLCGVKIRYFASGEYGEMNGKAHYHLIVWNIDKNDPVFYQKLRTKKGYSCYCKAWTDPKTKEPYGFVFLGDVSFDSCKYVAGYVAKKYKGRDAVEHYQKLGIEPEFCLSSRRPGIGGEYWEKYQDVVLKKGYITISGKKYDIPRYFEDKKKSDDPFYCFQKKIEVAKSQFEEEQRLRAIYESSDYIERSSYVDRYGEVHENNDFGLFLIQKDIAKQKEDNFISRLKRKMKGALNV